MTTAYFGSRSRLNVLSRILAAPVLLAGYAARTIYNEVRHFTIWAEIKDAALYAYVDIRDELSNLRSDFRPAVRFIMTGQTHDTAVRDRAVEVATVAAAKVQTVRDRVDAFFAPVRTFLDRHVVNRALALFFLAILPALALLYVGKLLKDDGFFSGLWEVVVGLVRDALIGGADPTEV